MKKKKLYSGNPMIHISLSPFEYKSLCCSNIARGEMLTHSPDTATCSKCATIFKIKIAETEIERVRPRTFKERLKTWSYFGGGEWGALEWLGIGLFTLGLGIPFIFALKHISKLVLKIFYA